MTNFPPASTEVMSSKKPVEANGNDVNCGKFCVTPPASTGICAATSLRAKRPEILSICCPLILPGSLAPTISIIFRRVEAGGEIKREPVDKLSACFYRDVCRDKSSGEAAGNFVHLLPVDFARQLSPYNFHYGFLG